MPVDLLTLRKCAIDVTDLLPVLHFRSKLDVRSHQQPNGITARLLSLSSLFPLFDANVDPFTFAFSDS